MSGPSTEGLGMPRWPDWTWPEARHLAHLYRQALGAIPDSLQEHLDALELAEQQQREAEQDEAQLRDRAEQVDGEQVDGGWSSGACR